MTGLRRAVEELVRRPDAGATCRVWVPGCSTGERVYEVAASLLKEADRSRHDLAIRIIATDSDDASLRVARRGRYPAPAAERISGDDLGRYFAKEGECYAVSERLRGMCIFSTHDVVRDVPFSRLDLIVCGELSPEQAQSARESLRYALKPGGILLALPNGPIDWSEILEADGETPGLFRARGGGGAPPPLPAGRVPEGEGLPPDRELASQHHQLVAARFAPASAVVDARGRILHESGPTGAFLAVPRGPSDTDLLSRAPSDLQPHLSALLERAAGGEDAAVFGVETYARDRPRRVDLHASPLLPGEDDEPRWAVTLIQRPPSRPDTEPPAESVEDRLQRAVEELEDKNEELCCLNEELETSRQEVLAVNEHLEAANQELQTSVDENERLRANLDNLIRGMRVPAVFLDRDLRIEWFSPHATAIFRLIDEDRGRPLEDLRPRIEASLLTSEIHEALGDHRPRELEVLRPADEIDSETRHYLARILPYRASGKMLVGVVVTFSDVTQLKRTSERLERYRKQQATLAELGLCALDSRLQDLFAWAAEAVQRTLGVDCCEVLALDKERGVLSPSAAVGWPSSVNASPEPLGAASPAAAAARSEEPLAFQDLGEDGAFAAPQRLRELGIGSGIACAVREGSEVYGVLAAYAVRPRRFSAAESTFLGTVCNLLASAAARHLAFARLRESERRLRDADRHKDEFLAMLGHELRNPLAAIAKAHHLLEVTDTGHGPVGRSTDVIGRQVAQMSRLLGDLLDVSRVSRGKISLREDDVELRELLESAVNDHPELEGSGLRTELFLPEDPVWVRGDRGRLSQAVGNLLSNAVRFTDLPGSVTVSLLARGSAAEIQVRDTGSGIAPELLEPIFEPFRQGGSRSSGGLGLGLALVRHIAKLHGGRALARSEGVGRGAEIALEIPRAEARAPSEPQPERPRGQVEIASILLVEDCPDNAALMAELLQRSGHEVRTAGDVREGLAALRERAADVVFCDLELPGELSGLVFARALKASPELRPRALFAFTGYGSERDRQATLEAGFDVHLTKPIDWTSLEDEISRALAKDRAIS